MVVSVLDVRMSGSSMTRMIWGVAPWLKWLKDMGKWDTSPVASCWFSYPEDDMTIGYKWYDMVLRTDHDNLYDVVPWDVFWRLPGMTCGSWYFYDGKTGTVCFTGHCGCIKKKTLEPIAATRPAFCLRNLVGRISWRSHVLPLELFVGLGMVNLRRLNQISLTSSTPPK